MLPGRSYLSECYKVSMRWVDIVRSHIKPLKYDNVYLQPLHETVAFHWLFNICQIFLNQSLSRALLIFFSQRKKVVHTIDIPVQENSILLPHLYHLQFLQKQIKFLVTSNRSLVNWCAFKSRSFTLKEVNMKKLSWAQRTRARKY